MDTSSTSYGLIGYLVLLVSWGTVGVVFGYFTALDAAGGTHGKRLTDLGVVTEDGESADHGDTAKRTVVLLAPLSVMALFGVVAGMLGFMFAVGLMMICLVVEAVVLFVSSQSQRLGDKLADTYVVEID